MIDDGLDDCLEYTAPTRANPTKEEPIISESFKNLVRKTRPLIRKTGIIWRPLLALYIMVNGYAAGVVLTTLRPDYKRAQIEKEVSEINWKYNSKGAPTADMITYYLLIKPTRPGREVAYVTYDAVNWVKDKI